VGGDATEVETTVEDNIVVADNTVSDNQLAGDDIED
jgi:hypothetical protein